MRETKTENLKKVQVVQKFCCDVVKCVSEFVEVPIIKSLYVTNLGDELR